MSRTWDPWRQSDEQPIVIPRHVLAPSIIRLGVGSEAEKGQETPRRQNDFISVLALAQHLNVDFLPITWHPAVETLGAGATAEIRQALVDIQISFAFKRIGLERKDAFTALASEISVLRTAEVSEHQNIISLVGICWDVDPDGPVIWPVLVFEKAPFGNLEDFLQSDLGRQLPTSQILSMMIDIGRALAYLHRNGIIHCDIKPDNLLVFQHDTNQYFIKVADFGYASLVTESDPVHLATPAAWTDPTYRGEGLEADTAKKMESYSFGLVCAWLFCKVSVHQVSQESGIPISSTAQFVEPEDWSIVLVGIPDLDADQIRNIREFFSLTLAADRDQRSIDFSELIKLLEDVINPVADKSICQNLLDDAPSTAFLSSFHTSTPSKSPNFQISRSLFRLLKTDFRLPGFIAKQLQEQADTLTDEGTRSNAQFQLAVCHAIGFGVRRSLEHSRQWLSACGKSDEDLESQVEQIRAENRWPYQNQRVKALETAGSLDLLDPRFLQDAVQILKKVELHYREQLQDFQHVFDPAHSVIVLTRYLLGNVLNKAGRYEEAYRLYLDLGKIMEGGESAWGPLHRSTLITWTQAAGMALKMGKNAEAESLYRKALKGQSLTLGLLHTETLSTTDSLALILEHQGKYLEAEKLSREAYEGRKRMFGDENPETLVSQSNLSTILVSVGKLQEARSLLNESTSARKRIFGRGNADTMICQSNLSAIHNLMGDFSEAERLANEVLQEMEETHGSNHPDTFHLLGNLVSTMHALGKNDRAKELGNRLLEEKQVIGIDNPYLLTVMSNMAQILQEEDRFEEALELDREILQRRIELLGEDHPSTMLTHNNIAATLQRQGKYIEAKEIYEKILDMRKDTLGENHPATIDTRANLAYLLQQMGDYGSALTLYEDAVKRSTETLGTDHPRTLMTKSSLGTLFLLLGNTAGAIDISRYTTEAQIKSLGESHPRTLQSMDNLAVALHKFGQNEEAERYFRRELQNESVLGTENLLMLNARNNLGMQLSGEGRQEEARECISRAIAGREKLLGADHPDTVTSLFNMACVDFGQDQYDPAIAGFRTAIEKRKNILGIDHPDTLHAMKFLAEALSRDGQYGEAEKLDSDVCMLTKQRYGDDHPESLATSTRVALALKTQGRLIEAEEILVRVVEASSRREDDEAHQQLGSRYYLALVRDGLGKYNEAEEDLRYALERREQTLGADHDDTLKVVNALGLVLRNLGQLDEAWQLLDRALKGREKIRGNERQVLETLALQGLVRQDQGDLDAAIQLNTRALAGWERLVGAEHPTTLGVVNNLASLAIQKMDGPETMRLHRRVMEGREKVLGPLHPDAIESTRALGAVSFSVGPEEEALPLYERAYTSTCQLYGPDDPRSKEIEEEMSVVRELLDEPKDYDVEQGPAGEQQISSLHTAMLSPSDV